MDSIQVRAVGAVRLVFEPMVAEQAAAELLAVPRQQSCQVMAMEWAVASLS